MKLNRWNLVWIAGLIGVVLNIVLSLALSPLASAKQIHPPDGAAQLNPFDQFMHMLVHHKQVLGTSSLIVFVVVSLSVAIGLALPFQYSSSTRAPKRE